VYSCIDLQNHADSLLDNRVTLTSAKVDACCEPYMECMSTDFGIDSSSQADDQTVTDTDL